MTDTETRRREAICKVAGVAEIDDVSDGFHTFRQLYYQRMILFAAIVWQNKDKAWKSFRHEDGELCFGGGWFIVGIDTPEGSYTYHYEGSYFGLFDCEELERGKHWDGHTEKDVTRLLSLPPIPFIPFIDAVNRQEAIDKIKKRLFETAFNNVGIKQDIDETLVDVAENRLKNWFDDVPSIQPERKKGTWTDDASCPFCGFSFQSISG